MPFIALNSASALSSAVPRAYVPTELRPAPISPWMFGAVPEPEQQLVLLGDLDEQLQALVDVRRDLRRISQHLVRDRQNRCQLADGLVVSPKIRVDCGLAVPSATAAAAFVAVVSET